MSGYSTREVAELLGLPTAQILGWTRSGLLTPERGPGGAYVFSFQDIVLLRTARELLDEDVPARRVRRALEALRAQLPSGRPLSAVSLSALGDRVMVRDEDATWDPDSGQIQMDLDGAAGADPSEPGEGGPHPPEAPKASSPPGRGELRLADVRASATPPSGGSGTEEEEEDTHDADDWFDRGVDLEAVATSEAIAAYRRAIDLDPAHGDALLNLGRLLHEEGDVERAVERYLAAAEADPGSARARYNLGVAYEDLGRTAEALAAYREALGIDDALAAAHFNLARLLNAAGEGAEALGHLHAYRRLLKRREGGTAE